MQAALRNSVSDQVVRAIEQNTLIQVPAIRPTASADITKQADLFRGGRLGMGWSQTDLARTILVQEEILQEWESGIRPIPTEILAWVGMYARSYPESGQEMEPTIEDRCSYSPAA